MSCFVFFFFVFHLFATSFTEFTETVPEHPETSVNEADLKNVTVSPVKFINFTDISCENVENVKLMKTSIGVFMLSRDNFFRLDLLGKEFVFIRKLKGIDSDVVRADACAPGGDDELILVVAFDDHLNVYRSKIDQDQDAAEPLDKLTVYGRLRKIICFKSSTGGVYLVLGSNFTEAHGRLSLFKWTGDTFELLEEKNMHSISDLHVLQGGKEDVILSIRYAKRSRAKTSVQSFVLEEKQLTRAQILHIDVDVVQPFVFNGLYYFFGYSRRLKECTVHYMLDEQFFEHSKAYFDGKLSTAAYGRDFLVCERNHEIATYISPSMECYAAFQPLHNDLSSIIAYTNQSGSNFILLNYIRPYSLLIQLIEVDFMPWKLVADDEGSFHIHPTTNFKGMLKNIKNFLFYRQSIASEIRSTLDRVRSDGERRTQDENLQKSERMRIHSGHLKRVDIVNPNLQTPTAIRAKFLDLKKRVRALRKAKRSAETLKETGDLLAEVLHVKNLIYNGTVFDGITKTADNKLIVKVPIQTKTMKADTISLDSSKSDVLSPTRENVGDPREDDENSDPSSMTIDGTIIIHDLNVENLNDLNWAEFRRGLFDKRTDKEVNGDLVFTDKASIGTLETEIVNDIPVRDFVTLHTDQDIEATFFVSKFYTTNVTAETVNGLNLATDVARIGVDNEIEGPVIFSYLNVTGDLQLAVGDDDNFARHIIGTRLEDLSQIYTGEIVINGSLTITNLTLDHPDTLVLVGGNQVDLDFENSYWMKSVDQNFGSVRFVNDIIAPNVQIDNLNGHHISSYLLRNENPSGPINLEMESVEIRGNIFVDAEYPSVLSEISRTAVRRNGRTVMQGDLHFVNDLVIDHMVTDYLNDVPVSCLVTQGMANVTFSGKKTFESLLVTDHLNAAGGLYVEYYDGQPLDAILNSMQQSHLSMTLNNVTFQGLVEVENLQLKFLNNVDLEELLKDMYEDNDRLYLQKRLTISGDVAFEGGLYVEKLNDISWNEYVGLLVNRNENAQVAGMKKFSKGLKVAGSLQAGTINDVNITHWYEYGFTKHDDQVIEAPWVVENAEFHDLFTNFIDDVPTQYLIDTRQPVVQINGNLLIHELYVANNVSGLTDLDLHWLKRGLSEFSPSYIKELRVLERVEWPETDTIVSPIQTIVRYAVRNGTDQYLTESILFSNKIGIRSATDPTGNLLNNIDIIAIAKDSLLKNAPGEQTVYAETHFYSSLTAQDLVSKHFLGAPVVNGVDVMALNASMYRLTDEEFRHPIYGHKEFVSPVRANKLTVYGTINSCSFKDVVLQSHHALGPLPAISIENVHVENTFEAGTVNDVDFREFLRSRMRKTGGPQDVYGYLTMEQLQLGKGASVRSINGINLNNVIVKNSDILQEVTGHKTIQGNLVLHGPSHVVHLNNRDVTNEYQNSIFLNRDLQLPELVVDNATLDQGVNISKTIDGHDVSYFLGVSEKVSSIISNDIQTVQQHLSQISREPREQQPKFLYLEIDDSIQFTYNQSTDNYIKREIFESDTLNDCLYKEMSFCSCLEQHCRTIVEVTPYSQIYISKVCGQHHPWLARAELNKLYVSTSNFCSNESVSSLNVTWIDENNRAVSYAHNYEQKIIVDVKLFDFPHSKAVTKYAIVELLSEKTNEVLLMLAVISLGEELTMQESLIYDFDLSKRLSERKNIKVKLFQHDEEATIILSLISYSENFYHHIEYNSYNNSKVLIYSFNHLKSRFDLKQEILGYHNIVGMTYLDDSTAHIALGCDICPRIIIYENSLQSRDQFAIKEVIKLNKKLSSLQMFTTKYGDSHLIVTCKNSNSYNLYKYYPLRGWQVLASGHERGLTYILSIGTLSPNGYHYILTISSQNEAKALMMYTQG